MLRLFSAKIFREDLPNFSLPMIAFRDYEEIEEIICQSNTFKFCIPVSIGDFAEVKIPACFSNNPLEIKEFIKAQKEINNIKAFIISDFMVKELAEICYSGIIEVYSKKGITNYYDKSTSICLTTKNPILTYKNEGISPRDLKADIKLEYNYVNNPTCAFPTNIVKNDQFNVNEYKDIIYDAYLASIKMHDVGAYYDGKEYREYALFFVDKFNKIHLYEIIGEESFLGKSNQDKKMIDEELNMATFRKKQLKICR